MKKDLINIMTSIVLIGLFVITLGNDALLDAKGGITTKISTSVSQEAIATYLPELNDQSVQLVASVVPLKKGKKHDPVPVPLREGYECSGGCENSDDCE